MADISGAVAVLKEDLDILVAACTSYLPPHPSPEVTEAFGRILAAWDGRRRGTLAGGVPAGPSGTEFAVFWGGDGPDDCAGWELKDSEAEAEEDARWRVTGGVAERAVLYGPWTVTVAPVPGEGD